jgi:hypothetical protein
MSNNSSNCVSPCNELATNEVATNEVVRFERKVSTKRRNEIFRALRRSVRVIAKEKRDAMQKHAAFAKLCVLDAFQGRLSNGLANNSKKAAWIYNVFCIQTSSWMFQAVVIGSVLHTFSIFLEPANSCPNSILFKLMQYLILIIYATDIGLKMSYEGVHVSSANFISSLICNPLSLSLLFSCTCSPFLFYASYLFVSSDALTLLLLYPF